MATSVVQQNGNIPRLDVLIRKLNPFRRVETEPWTAVATNSRLLPCPHCSKGEELLLIGFLGRHPNGIQYHREMKFDLRRPPVKEIYEMLGQGYPLELTGDFTYKSNRLTGITFRTDLVGDLSVHDKVYRFEVVGLGPYHSGAPQADVFEK